MPTLLLMLMLPFPMPLLLLPLLRLLLPPLLKLTASVDAAPCFPLLPSLAATARNQHCFLHLCCYCCCCCCAVTPAEAIAAASAFSVRLHANACLFFLLK